MSPRQEDSAAEQQQQQPELEVEGVDESEGDRQDRAASTTTPAAGVLGAPNHASTSANITQPVNPQVVLAPPTQPAQPAQAAAPATAMAVPLHDLPGLAPNQVIPAGFHEYLLGHVLRKLRAGEPGMHLGALPGSLQAMVDTDAAGEESDRDADGEDNDRISGDEEEDEDDEEEDDDSEDDDEE
ncbi:hypothetical protein GLAREA_09039 [Glarea lozoyensis ATCC 20868]|uniref:Uncharacterized protein n=1 Tax=Glarea lozoyensis (strain ATCC 20868 / MF5171) TaxID=1116229 RepID=S3DY81_GLAL2|nr:uncharacterized protein GLAREA_09039 [Glarea lozoyensis ATCC 20868]EPE36876.1 hypothetical protein GLAREA_09039 [Glarea lozoyensis ATCC 20868]